MNKILKYILMITIIFFTSVNTVFGYVTADDRMTYSENYEHECVSQGTCDVVCKYRNNFCNINNDHTSSVVRYNAAIYYDKIKKNYYAIWQKEGSGYTYISSDLKDTVFISSQDLLNLKNGVCPAYGYVDQSTMIFNTSEVCFGTKEYCQEKSGWGTKFIEDEGTIDCTETKEDGTVAVTGTELIEDNADKVAADNNIAPIDVTDNSSFTSCKDVIGSNVYNLFQKVFKIIYVIVPFLVLLLGMLDFGRAVLSSKEDEMTKSKQRFMKRIIMGVAVFIVPTLINILFYVVNFAKDPSDSNNFFNYIRGDICIDE